MPDGFEIAQRGGMRGGFPRGGMPRGGFPRGGFPGRFPMGRFPHRFPMRRRFPRFFFFPIFFPQNRCEFIDRWGRCCDRWGNCGDWDMGGWSMMDSDDMSDSWFGMPVAWDRIEDPGMDEDQY